ncbi:uncharacterized protein LOC100834511 [Brachypodium distachyon]|uniref:Bifunctional inhibitor/plant lipid transfer protein/seed storage helical domain-containing protein n=1 Tax=Brachypodium distachyon TaxID=15368 RepID=I1I3E1_BRADI|nr:uncharacterized protein LOC100834511 [Brachypodium distachyon]KQJ96350.1 hypothetical protein BRADI_3g22595v3 [Brachypodium distachyon]|eukprot:XP_003571708.1 uncharacterized protein LOC100834511 [Brachypodium distachyon]
MASSSTKLAAALAVLALWTALAATTATAYPAESCATQSKYFINCLRRGFGPRCCAMVENPKCFCVVEQEAEIRCVPGRSCPSRGVAKVVKVAELHLSCMKDLKCKRA